LSLEIKIFLYFKGTLASVITLFNIFCSDVSWFASKKHPPIIFVPDSSYRVPGPSQLTTPVGK
jgi:hypothetical protein